MIRLAPLALAALACLAACSDAEPDDLPGMAEAEPDPIEGDFELDAETELYPSDEGRMLMATGHVVGESLDRGFHLRTAADRVIFVDARANVREGDLVRVIGPLVSTDAAIFESWTAQAFESGHRPEWKVETRLFIDAVSVLPLALRP